MKNENSCVIVKAQSEKPGTPSRHVAVRTDVYDKIYSIANDSGRSVRYVVSKLLAYAISNVEIADEE